MISKLCFKRCFLVIFAFCVANCNDQNQANNPETPAATSNDTTAPSKYTPFDASRSVTRISPGLYKQLADTLNIRVIQGTYKPGDSSIMHAHPDFALYILEGGTVELTAEDGNKQKVEFKKDMAVVLPAATHSAKNIGKTTLRLIVVEVNRPRD
jgi:quercetin dioxygenase-like cupin family protein